MSLTDKLNTTFEWMIWKVSQIPDVERTQKYILRLTVFGLLFGLGSYALVSNTSVTIEFISEIYNQSLRFGITGFVLVFLYVFWREGASEVESQLNEKELKKTSAREKDMKTIISNGSDVALITVAFAFILRVLLSLLPPTTLGLFVMMSFFVGITVFLFITSFFYVGLIHISLDDVKELL